MESQRSFLVIGLLMVSFLLWQQWQMDYAPQPINTASVQQQESGVPVTGTDDQEVPSAAPTNNGVPANPQTFAGQLINVKTDTLDVVISTVGGDVVSANLVKYPVTQGSNDYYSLLRQDPAALYVAQSGLIGPHGIDTSTGRAQYHTTQTEYALQGDTLTVPMTITSDAGLVITKTFTFTRGSHLVDIHYDIHNTSAEPRQLQQYAQLKQSVKGPEGSMFMPTYRGAAYSTAEEQYEKYSFEDIEDTNLRTTTPGGWVGMLEHYFVSAWVPPQEQTNNLYSRVLSGQYATIGYTGESVSIAPEQQIQLGSQLYMGPKDQDTLKEIARGLDLTVDYGFLWFISQLLFDLLQFLHGVVGNWGVAIILITIIVKGAMYWLTKKQYESMAKMRNLAPKMQQLKDRFGDDRQKMSQAMMDLYRKEKVNPAGGCFPLLLQMPIFLALYWVLLESVELRHAEFFLWITDLSVKDPYFVLPVLTGASMYLLQKLQPMTIQDPMQQKIMQWMPVFMSIFFLWFPAGLVLYWLISNVITLIQAKIIYASMEKRGIKTR